MSSILKPRPSRTRTRSGGRDRVGYASHQATGTPASVQPTGDEYVAFGNVEARNGLQAWLEIPAMIYALRLPYGKDILEIGCGRGVALPVLSERLMPASLVGLDNDRALVAVADERIRRSGVDARVLEADARDMPIESESVDVV